MNENYTFVFEMEDKPVFEKDGRYFYTRLIDEELLAFGLFTDDPEGFEPVGEMREYGRIKEIADTNARLSLLSVVGADKDTFMVAADFSGEYEYFKLWGLKLQDINNSLAELLCKRVDAKRRSSFIKPYRFEVAGDKITAVK